MKKPPIERTAHSCCCTLAVLAALCVATAPSPSLAATWNGVSSGNTSDGANWIGRSAPALSEEIVLTNYTDSVLYITNDIPGQFTKNYTVGAGRFFFAGAYTNTIYSSVCGLFFGADGKSVSAVNTGDWWIKGHLTIGGTDGSDSVLTNRSGKVYVNQGGNAVSHSAFIGGIYNQHPNSKGTLVVEGGEIYFGKTSGGKALAIGQNAESEGLLHIKGGTVVNYNVIHVGAYGKGTLILDGGTLTAVGAVWVGCASGSSGTVELNGGTLEATQVTGGGKGGTFTFNGGTLVLTSSSDAALDNLSVVKYKVGAGTSTISTAGANASSADISSALDSGTDGGLKFAGGGSMTFTGSLTYTGATRVELGTSVTVPSASSIGAGLVVTIPATVPADGVYTVLATTGDDTLEAVFAAATLPTDDANARFRLSSDKKSILCLYGDVAQEWIGGATGSLGDAANWSTGIVPTDGNAVISSAAAATLTNSAAFTPTSITFSSGSAQVTIVGESELSGLLAITNETSGTHHVFECPVAFAANTEADLVASRGSANYVTFAGGMTAYTLKQSGAETYLAGNVTITKEIDNWARYVEIDFLHLVSGATLTIPYPVTMNGESNFHIESGATLSIDGDFKTYASSGSVGFANRNNGTIDVNGLADARSHTAGLIYFALNTSTGVLKAKGIVSSSSSADAARFVPNSASGNGIWVVGENGISGAGQYYIQSGKSVTFHPAADYTISRSLAGNNNGTYTLATTDYNDPTTSRTITINAAISSGKIVVNGTGCVLFNATGGTTQGLSVNDSATVAVNAGKQPGKGAVTLNGTSTLKVAQSGTVALGGALTVGADATLAFNFTANATAPVLSASSATVSGETLNVKVSAADGIRPKGGTHTLTSGGAFAGATATLVDPPEWAEGVAVNADGNLVLSVKRTGLILMFK